MKKYTGVKNEKIEMETVPKYFRIERTAGRFEGTRTDCFKGCKVGIENIADESFFRRSRQTEFPCE